MSDHLQHECGIAMLRLLKPLEYYKEKYGTPFYGINKMYLMLEKQHNRGQDGAGLASVKFDMLARDTSAVSVLITASRYRIFSIKSIPESAIFLKKIQK